MKIKIQIDKKIAQELAYMQQRGMEPKVQVEGQDTLVIVVDKEEDLSLKAAHVVESGANKVARVGDETLKLVMPVAKAAGKATGGLLKATVRAITAAGSTLVTEAKDTAKEIKKELKKNTDA